MAHAPSRNLPARPAGARAALAAAAVGLVYAGVSLYWAAGGTWLLSTVSPALIRPGAVPLAGLAAWAAVVLKVTAAAVPVLAVTGAPGRKRARAATMLAWVQATVLILYGFTLTAVEVTVEILGVLPAAARRSYAWHAYLWDPWFLLWGLLVAAALARHRGGRRSGRRGPGTPRTAGTRPSPAFPGAPGPVAR
jgi:hypothetical protein